jgi:2-keto-3-deoxy-6-phosphogluconate aldolase
VSKDIFLCAIRRRQIHPDAESSIAAGRANRIGSVNQLTAANFILAGASSLGIGSELMPRIAVSARLDQWIHELARRFIEAVRNARIQLAARVPD